MSRSSFGSVRKRPDTGRWQARYQDAGGRQHSATFGTKNEAASWLRLQATEREAGSWVDPRAGKAVFEPWARQWAAGLVGRRVSTLTRDLGYLDWYIMPTFGEMELREIEAPGVRAWVAKLDETYKPFTVIHAANLLRQIMAAAVVARLISSNPVDGVSLPKIEPDEMRFLTPAEIWRLHDAIDERYRGAILLAAYGGLRAGELWALKVGRVNPLRGLVEVIENEVEVAGRIHEGQPKTKAGRRRVPVPGFVIEAMRLDGRAPTSLVFPAPMGGYVRRSNWRRRFFLPALEAAGLDAGFRFHDLRHTAVALWIEAGASPVEIARRAGHSSPAFVLQRYGHLMPWAEDRVTKALEGFGRPSGDAPVVPFGHDLSGVDDGVAQ